MGNTTNKATLSAYSSDGSIYAVKPQAVKHVHYKSDVVNAVEQARQENISITPRGAGTGLVGGALGSGMILDFSGFRKVININKPDPNMDTATVRTQVGIIYDELNLVLKRYGLFFPPDPSSGDSCQIGGMIANNSSGPKSVKYGLTSDFVEELEVVNSSGKLIRLKKYKIDSPELSEFYNKNPEYRGIYKLLIENTQLIKDKWPRIKKNSAGYNLRQVVNDFNKGVFNLPALMVGSEGTLSLFLTAELKILPLPEENLTIRIYFKSLAAAGRSVCDILELNPSGLEIVDGATLNLIGREKFEIPEKAAALLLIEFDDNIKDKRQQFEKLASRLDLVGPAEYADEAEESAPLWQARKAIVPTLYRYHPTKRPIPLVEDLSISPDKIPSFIEFATNLFDSFGLPYGIFGHIGDGNLHIRPLFDLNDPDDFKLAGKIYNIFYDKVISLGGSTTAEHADGRLRPPVLKKLYGRDIYDIFVKIKRFLDPDNIFSPDSILGLAGFSEKIDYEKIKLYCAACGKCNGYCPVYDIFRREDFSPRGWLRMLHQTDISYNELDSYLSYCLNCKNCTDVCPADVDIAREIINHRNLKPSPLAESVAELADSEIFLSLSLKLGKLAEPLMNSKFGKKAIELISRKPFGIDSTTSFPAIADKDLRRRFADRIDNSGEVAFFHGCADNLLESSVGEAVFKVFDYLGIDLFIPKQKCCGLPYEVNGLKDFLIEKAKFNIDQLKGFKSVITGCASCLLKLKEYKTLLKDDAQYSQAAADLAGRCFDISQFLNKQEIDYSNFKSGKITTVTYHNPCHLRAAELHKEPEKLFSKLPNVEIRHPQYANRCCAQAGSYGFTHYRESKNIFAKKKEAYDSIEAEYLATSCPACQMKIRAEMNGKFKVVHPVEILASRISFNSEKTQRFI